MTPSDTWNRNLEASTVTGRGGSARPEALQLPGLTILAHPDVRRVGERVSLADLASGREVELSRLAPSFASPAGGLPPRPLADPGLSRQPLRLVHVPPDGIRLVRGELPGDCQVDGVPLPHELLLPESRVERGVVLLLADRVALLLHRVMPVVPRDPEPFGLVGASDVLFQLRREIRRVAKLDVPVLLRGETGTGKELVARAVHSAGPRRERPFVAVNVAAVPPSLAAAELFGAERGAFTGAEGRRSGAFRRADGGTLFLDELGAAATDVQDLLLRALETREIQPLGSDTTHRVDVRIVTATDADLDAAIAAGRFRGPLLYRLSGWEIRLPPLRDRRDDVARLLVHFLRQELDAVGAGRRLRDPGPRGVSWLGASLVARLVACDWPGNVRQLKNVARRLAIGCHDLAEATLDPQLEDQLFADKPVRPDEPAVEPAPARSRRSYRKPGEIDDAELLAALRRNRWRLRPTAEELGVSRTSLYALIDRSPRIRKAADLRPAEIAACLERNGGDLDAAVEELEVSRHGLQLRILELGLDPRPNS